ncbi:MAG: mechanosensitive ion channel [Desulforhopalus sp.]|nr:mechanosensitive ion channel [Desulforhopalus sp.]
MASITGKDKSWFLALLLWLFFSAVQAAPAWCAEAEGQPLNFDKTQAKIKELSRQIKGGRLSPQQLESAQQLTSQFTKAATVCIDTATEQISRLEQETASLGPSAAHEAAEIVKERKSLAKQKQALQITLSECRLLTTLTTRLDNELADQNKQLQTANFFSRTENFLGRFATTLPTSDTFADQVKTYTLERSGFQDLTPPMLLILTLLVIGGTIAGLKIFRLLQHLTGIYCGRQDLPPTLPLRGSFSLPMATATLMAGGYLLYLTWDSQPPVYGPWLFVSVGLYFLARFLFHLRCLLVAAKSTDQPVSLPVRRFAALAGLASLLFFTTRIDLGDFGALVTLRGLGQSLIICAICCLGWWFLWPIKLPAHLNHFDKSRLAAITLTSLLVIGVELSGYRNLSFFILNGLLGTVVLATLLRLLLFAIDEIIGGCFSGKYRWQQGLRQKLGLHRGDRFAGTTWIRLIFKLLAWAVGLLLFLKLWGLPEAQEKVLHGYLVDGFTIGGLLIAPARIVFGVFIFACGWTAVSWLKMQMEKRWLRHAGFSQSAQETLVTMTGYCGFALALIIGLSSAGFSFSSLAFIAGALSVGIGFGMQNIVNNFVSGLIILFERPVKRGDWISIGKTEGYVQKISVRSTLIQTFDRSDVIVPNSELISNQVTNMMLNDNFGRLIVPVGVAYGSDTELVRTLLLEIAANNEQVVNDGSAPKPVVLFLAFGDNALSFELRCHLVNIDKRLAVKSAINYEIDRAFRKHNISMPFPQRDLYIKEFPFPDKKI